MNIRDSEAIVLRTFKLSEADKIVVCLTKTYGLIRGVAKGARRLKSRFGASLEPFSLIKVSFIEKEGRELVTLTQTEIVRSYFSLARLDETYAGLEYLSELAIEFAPPNHPDERFFRMVTSCVEAVEASPERLHAVARYFELWALRLSGFLADVSKCSRCGRQFTAEGNGKVYATAEFALHCENCAERMNRELEPALYGHLRSARYLSPSEWSLSYSRASRSSQEGFARIVRTLLERHLERSPRGHSASLPIRRPGAV
jgi:DNA repair protein RecO (recombination protein O)